MPFDHLLALYGWGGSRLTAPERAAVEQLLKDKTPSAEQARGWSFWRMIKTYERMESLAVPEEERNALLLGWLNNRDLETIDDVGHVGWLCEKIAALGSRTDRFSVQWTGFDPGSPRRRLCLLHLSDQRQFGPCEQLVSADDQGIDRENARTRLRRERVDRASGRVPLQCRPAEPLLVEFSYVLLNQQYMDRQSGRRPADVGRAGNRSASGSGRRLLAPRGKGAGLRAEYRVKIDEEEQTSTRTEATIDHVWATPSAVLPHISGPQARLMARFCELAVEPAYLGQVGQSGDAPGRHAWWMYPQLLQHMDCSQQADCVEQLLARPALLAAPSAIPSVNFYWSFRGADLDGSLAVLGEWAQLHPDAEPDFVLP